MIENFTKAMGKHNDSNEHKQINTSSFFFTGVARFLSVLTVALDRLAGTPWPPLPCLDRMVVINRWQCG
jgi:hypothetical protein